MTETDTTPTLFCHTPDGAKLAYRVLGAKQKGVPLIMLTGMASVKEDWDDLASVCIYDHRGIGASTLSPPLPPFKTAPSLTPTQLSTDTFHILHDALQWRTFHVLGMSMGGMVAQQLVLLLRGRDDYECRSMTVLASSARPRGGRLMAEYYGCLCGEVERRESGGGGTTQGKGNGKGEVEKVVRRFLEGNLTPRWCRENNGKVDEMMRSNARARKPAKIIIQQIEALSTGFDLTPQLPLITVPTLVIHGTHDEIIPVEHGHAIASGIPRARFLPLQDVGHITYRMDEGQTLRAVDGFLREIDAKSAVESLAVKL
ncbi:hypothetical protein HDU89_008250 [Geranomyces variabilis]|nr:hypothetical protein HDU89_008250 [Geranomyces variabilis]